MPIVGGLDIHRKQLTFDYLDTVTGEVKRGQIAPADRAHLRAGWCGSPAVTTSRSRWRGAPGGGMPPRSWPRRGSPRMSASLPTPPLPWPQAARQDRQDRLPAPAGGCWPRQAARMLDPARADPGVPGAAGDLPRPAGRAHRLGAAHPRGVLPPGRPAAGRGRAAHRAGPGRAAGGRGRAPVAGRAAAGGHRPGHARRPRSPAWTCCARSCRMPPGT